MGLELEKGTLIGKGRDAEVLYWGNNQILKLFWKEISRLRIDYELDVSGIVQKYYKCSPKVFNKIKINNREGIIYEFIGARNMVEETLKKPQKVRLYAKTLAKLHAEMHQLVIPELISQKTYFRSRIRNVKLLNKDQKKLILKYLRTLPGDKTLCHGDFHMENVLISKNGPIVIDWSNSTAGNPLADVARTLYILNHGHDPSSSERSRGFNFLIKFFRFYFVKKYFKTYKRLRKVSLKEIKKWNLIIHAVRLGEEIPEEQEYLLKEINKEINRLRLN